MLFNNHNVVFNVHLVPKPLWFTLTLKWHLLFYVMTVNHCCSFAEVARFV